MLATGCGAERSAPAVGQPCPQTPPVTDSGKLKGVEDEGTCAYLGVPYAEPPVDDLRWRAPVRINRRLQSLVVDTLGSPCMQVDFSGTVSGSEDCLTLNVWRPEHDEGLLPVLVFFHGGGNVMGSAVDARYHGAELARALGALVVSVQFRIGTLGYLVHPALSAENDLGVSGNYGLLDQFEALWWIRRNVYALRGDANRVTLMGQSAGARNICALATIPEAASLFRGAILHSGACNAREYADSERHGIQVSQALGCELEARPALCMRRKSAALVTTALPSLPDPMTISRYNPTVDGALLYAQPLAALAGQHTSELPVIVGTNADETAPVTPRIEGEDEYRALLRAEFGEALVEPVLATYPISDFGTATEAAVAVVSEARYACAARQASRALVAGGATPYRFWFSHRPENPPYSEYGATHGLELMYLFGTWQAYGYVPGAEDRRIATDLRRFYGNFVRDGDPGKVGARTWPSEADSEGYVMRFGAARPNIESGRDERCDFWESLSVDTMPD